MWYVKNVPTVERVIRLIMGLVLLGGARAWMGPTASGWIMGSMGMVAAVSGLIGWCPMCAMLGRKPATKHSYLRSASPSDGSSHSARASDPGSAIGRHSCPQPAAGGMSNRCATLCPPTLRRQRHR
jgi:DUF2892 family protein